MEQAFEWAGKIPFREGRVEIRRIMDEEDFGSEITEELHKRKEVLRKQNEEVGK